MSFFDAATTDDTTIHGLEKWMCHMFEQLGWMTLAYKNNRQDKVASYIVTINKLKNSIESRLNIVINEDTKLDLKNILTKVSHLQNVVSKLFDLELLKNTVCAKCNLPSKNNNDVIQMLGGSKLKKLSKKSSKKLSKKSSKKLSKKSSIKTHNEPLIKKLSKKSSKTLTNKVFKKL